MFSQFKSFIQPYKEKIDNLLKFGKITLVSGANGQVQKIQVKTLRNIEDTQKAGQFGFNSKAPAGSRVVVAEISNEKIVISNEHIESIIDISSGNTVIYNQSGHTIKIEGDTITATAPNIISNCTNFTVNSTNTTINASTKFTVNSPLSEFSDLVNSLGLLSALNYSGLSGSSMTTNVNLVTTGDVIASGVSLVNHPHNQGNDSLGASEVPTDAPTPTA